MPQRYYTFTNIRLLPDSNPDPTVPQSASLTTIPEGHSRQVSMVVSHADCCLMGPGFESRRRHGCL
ncbi:hypothetical protein TNCV_3762071 [Trichonephila clavipes]|nr:hypothetical protein TNCV_3762071 [Trichonephila clavipes]